MGDKVKLGESVDVIYEVVEFDDTGPSLVKVVRGDAGDNPAVYPHWWRLDLLHPAD